MKTGTPKVVQDLKESFESKQGHGIFHVWGIQFEDGTGGRFNVKDSFEPRFIVGEKAGYETTPNGEYPNKIKFVDLEYEQNKETGLPGKRIDRNVDSIIWQSCFKSVCAFAAGKSGVNLSDVLGNTDEAYLHCKALTENSIDSLPPKPEDLQKLQPEEDELPF